MYRFFFLILISVLFASTQTLQSQPLKDSIEAQVTRALHGADGKGRDGPMSRLDRGLIALYYRYRAFEKAGKAETFSPRDGSLHIRDSLVTVDAIAAGSPQALLDSLTALGLREAVQAERLISGKLPIPSLREAAQLSALQSMRPSRGQTGGRSGSIGDPAAMDKSGGKKEASDRDTASENDTLEAPSGAEQSQRKGQSSSDLIRFRIWYALAGAFLLGVALIFALRKRASGVG